MPRGRTKKNKRQYFNFTSKFEFANHATGDGDSGEDMSGVPTAGTSDTCPRPSRQAAGRGLERMSNIIAILKEDARQAKRARSIELRREESLERRQKRQEKDRQRTAARRQNETDTDRAQRLANDRQRTAARRQNVQNIRLQNSSDQSISVPRVEKKTIREAANGQLKNFRKVKNKEIKSRSSSVCVKLGRPNFQFYSIYKKDRLKKVTSLQPKRKRTAVHRTRKRKFPLYSSAEQTRRIWRVSMVWKYFAIVEGGAMCKECKQILKLRQRTSECLEHHLSFCHTTLYEFLQQTCMTESGGTALTLQEPLKTYSRRMRRPLQIQVIRSEPPFRMPVWTKAFEPGHKREPGQRLDVETSGQLNSPIKQEPVETSDAVEILDSVNVIVPDTTSVPSYPTWIKTEPENDSTGYGPTR